MPAVLAALTARRANTIIREIFSSKMIILGVEEEGSHGVRSPYDLGHLSAIGKAGGSIAILDGGRTEPAGPEHNFSAITDLRERPGAICESLLRQHITRFRFDISEKANRH
jgi:hypothetical protein